MTPSRYISFTRDEWAQLRASTPLTLDEDDLTRLRSINERISLDEVARAYLPLSRLLNLHVAATQGLHRATGTFLGDESVKVPYIIGVAGSVAVGKSTTARILQALLARWDDHPEVALVTTDGFLYPNAILEARGIMHRKGFPESYDQRRLLRFVSEIKAGAKEVSAPVYSHLRYDIVPDEMQIVRQPDILILEGLNVLQPGDAAPHANSKLFVSDFFDFSIYVDADEQDITRWFLERFHQLRATVFQDPNSYFHRYAELSDAEATALAQRIWREINGVNLRENILPTRERARLILRKGECHTVEEVRLRKL